MKKQLLLSALIGLGCLSSQAQINQNVGFLGQKTYSTGLNDVWGYADANSNEYALVGVRNGFSVVDVTNPAAPVEEFFIPGKTSTWRDIKTWDHYAYVMHDNGVGFDANNGLLIVDLDSLENPHYKFMYPPYIVNDTIVDSAQTSHNLWIDENGFLYVFGSNIGLGGALIYDLNQDPWNPEYAGLFNAMYLHDGYVRGDTLWGAGLGSGMIVCDISNKKQSQFLAQFNTPSVFAHNCWLSDDGKALFTTDEVSSGYIAAYDVSDFSNVQEVDRFRITPNNNTIPHNAHVYGDFLVTSYYTYGLQIMDIKDPSWMIEVGNYDTSPLSGDGYDGAWGAYPYLPSGNVLISDMQEGLFVLAADYVAASRLYGAVLDSVSGTPLPGALAYFKTTQDTIVLNSSDASFRLHHIGNYVDTLVLKANGYRDLEVEYSFDAGELDTVDFKMLPIDFSIGENTPGEILISPNPAKDFITIQSPVVLESAGIRVIDLTGRTVLTDQWTSGSAEHTLDLDLTPGVYLVEVQGGDLKWIERLVCR